MSTPVWEICVQTVFWYSKSIALLKLLAGDVHVDILYIAFHVIVHTAPPDPFRMRRVMRAPATGFAVAFIVKATVSATVIICVRPARASGVMLVLYVIVFVAGITARAKTSANPSLAALRSSIVLPPLERMLACAEPSIVAANSILC